MPLLQPSLGSTSLKAKAKKALHDLMIKSPKPLPSPPTELPHSVCSHCSGPLVFHKPTKPGPCPQSLCPRDSLFLEHSSPGSHTIYILYSSPRVALMSCHKLGGPTTEILSLTVLQKPSDVDIYSGGHHSITILPSPHLGLCSNATFSERLFLATFQLSLSSFP